MKTFKHKTTGSIMTYKDGCMQIGNLVIEGTPNLNYWEEIVEKDYEILSFYNKNDKDLFIKKQDGLFYFRTWGNPRITGLTEEDFLDSDSSVNTIHSVKRLSDGEEFTIGDTTNKGIIKAFIDFGHTLHCDCSIVNTSYFSGNINKLSPINAPLFTTEDNYKIYPDDTY